MGTTSFFQSKLKHLSPTALLHQVVYTPKLIYLGSGQGSWTPTAYMHASRDVLKISLDDMQFQKNTIADNVFRRIGITATSETITINPIVLEIVESSFAQRNVQDVIPLVLTEMHRMFDQINAIALKTVAKECSSLTWECAPKFINDIIKELTTCPYDMIKHLIIPSKIFIALNAIANYAEEKHWLEEFQRRLSKFNTTLRVSDAIGDAVYLIQEPLLAEYRGLIPSVLREGFDDRSNEYWLQFLMSNSDFKPRVPDALRCYTMSGLDSSSQLSTSLCSS